MGRFKILVLILTLFLVLIPKTKSQWQPPVLTPHPLCASQIALANYACALLPYAPMPPTPPLPPSPPADTGSRGPTSSHSHRHRHRHSHRHNHPASPAEENCCRWVHEVDSECVCELLSRLPVFLERPRHNFTIAIGDACDVTYPCGGGTKF